MHGVTTARLNDKRGEKTMISPDKVESPSADVPELRVTVSIHKNVHERAFMAIYVMPTRFRSERIRSLMDKGLLYEEQSHLLKQVSDSRLTDNAPVHRDNKVIDILTVRIPVRFSKVVHEKLYQCINEITQRDRSSRIRTLVEKGLLYEEQSYLLRESPENPLYVKQPEPESPLASEGNSETPVPDDDVDISFEL